MSSLLHDIQNEVTLAPGTAILYIVEDPESPEDGKITVVNLAASLEAAGLGVALAPASSARNVISVSGTVKALTINNTGTGNTLELQASGVTRGIIDSNANTSFGSRAAINPTWSPSQGVTAQLDAVTNVLHTFTAPPAGTLTDSVGLYSEVIVTPADHIVGFKDFQAITAKLTTSGDKNVQALTGIWSEAWHEGSGTCNILRGFQTEAIHYGSAAMTSLRGVDSGIYLLAAGNVTNAIATYSNVANWGAGTITNAYGVRAGVFGSGPITNAYGLYIDAVTVGSTNKYNLYSAGATSKNHFVGSVAIGGATIGTNALAVTGKGNVTAPNTSTSGTVKGFEVTSSRTPASASSGQNAAGYFLSTLEGTQNSTGITTGIYAEGRANSSGVLTHPFGYDARGAFLYATNYAASSIGGIIAADLLTENNTGTLGKAYGARHAHYNYAGATTSSVYGFICQNAELIGGSIGNQYGFYCEDLSGATTNYPLWIDTQGVYRIRAENDQSITALYNPSFTKYTPGAANYERIVQQWTSDVAQLGTEAGGTGTLRPLQLLGSYVKAEAFACPYPGQPAYQGIDGSIGNGFLHVFLAGIGGGYGLSISASLGIILPGGSSLYGPRMFGWSSVGFDTIGTDPDTALGRNAAGVVEINNGTMGTLRDLRLRTLLGKDGSGSNAVGENTTIAPGKSTGNAQPAKVVIQSSVAVASGSAAQTLSDTLIVTNSRVGVGGDPDSKFHVPYSNTAGMRIDFNASGDNYFDGVRHFFRGPSGNAFRWTIDTDGHLMAGADNTYDIGASGATRPRNVYVAGTIVASGGQIDSSGFNANSAAYFYWSGRSALSSPSSGIVTLEQNGGGGFDRLQFGGTTSSYPALKRSGATLQVRRADDSAFTDLRADQFVITADDASSATMFNQYGLVLSSSSSLSFRSGGNGTVQDSFVARVSSGVFAFGTTSGGVDGTLKAAVVQLGSYTVAGLPAGTAGDIAYASNGRKAGEGAGVGTGVLVFKDGSNWIAVDTGAAVAA
jgi:hypothetical protein